jgi:hypothetical protein
VLGVLLLLQAAAAPACSSDPLCRLLQDAAAVNRRAMQSAGGYRASIETESATLGRRENRMEGISLLEQRSGTARWSTDIGFDYHLIGSRSFPNEIPLSRLAFLRIGWVTPTLAASPLQVITRSGRVTHAETRGAALAPVLVIHPLGEERERYYRYEGGQSVRRQLADSEREVLAIEVIPREDISGEHTLFEGELELDPQTHALVRLFGRFRSIGRPKHFLSLPHFDPAATRVDLLNQRLPNGMWVPLMQRYEIQTASSLTAGYGGTRRVISRFANVQAIPAGRAEVGATATLGYGFTSAPHDSLRGFRRWQLPAGEASTSVAGADFIRYYPGRLLSTGKPIALLQGIRKGEFVRYNRIEGAFTGLAGTLRLRDAAPGLFLHGTGGYAWKEKTVRGGGDVGWESRGWTVSAGVARSLEVTNKFRNQFDNPMLAALAGRDNWDYVERRKGQLSLTRVVAAARGGILQLEAARVEDVEVFRHLEHALVGKRLRLNRGMTPGSYWRGIAVFDWNPAVSPIFSHDGIGFRGEVETASGDLDYTRLEGRLVLRKSTRRVALLARLHGGAVLGDSPPPQQLFELGDPSGLPGYGYKEFAGTRAALFRTRLTVPLGLFDRPWAVSSGFILPAFSPAISLGFQSGIANAPTAAGLAAVRALGDKYDDKTGALLVDPVTGAPLPAAVAGNKLHSSVDVRIGLFGDALAVGIARGLEKGRKMKFIFGFGRQF